MKVRRILQLLLAAFFGQGLTVLSQLLVPPFFLRFYDHGMTAYGEWIALSASVTYLSTLNYGIQTYASNQMTILYGRGDVRGARAVQASAFRLLLSLGAVFAVGGLIVFWIPLASALRLTTVQQHTAAVTLYLLILQIALVMLFGLLTNSYMAVGLLHRGNYISSLQRLFSILGMALLLFLRSSFAVLAAFQLICLAVFAVGTLFDLRRQAPDLVPSLSAGSWSEVRKILVPSGHFFLISVAGFLTWQAPVLVIQRVLGAEVVALFAIVRVVFQMSRQILSVASGVLAQDITLMVGKREWRQLSRLYDLSERLVLFLIPPISIGSLMMCPFLFTLWLHKRWLYHPELCFIMAIISAVLGLKEHKMQFQQSSNEHEGLSKIMLVGYSVMLGVSVVAMKFYGLTGFLLTWLGWEILQTGIVVRLNGQIFPDDHRLDTAMLYRFLWMLVLSFAAVALPVRAEAQWPLWESVAVALLAVAVLSGVSYVLFQLDELRALLWSRFRNRTAGVQAA